MKIHGVDYQIAKKMDARTQFHVARRLMPIMGSLVGLIKSEQLSFELALPAMAEQVAAMPDTDVNFVLDACLALVQRKQGESWSPVLAGNGEMMFDDIDMMAMLSLAGKVIEENLSGFFAMSGLPSSQASTT